MISSLNDLRLIPLDYLILHEAHDPLRLEALRNRIEAEGVQRNPVIASKCGDEHYLVLDGAHRVKALEDIGCRFILVQLVEMPERAEGWRHLLNAARLRGALSNAGVVEVSEGEADSWLAAVEFTGGEKVFIRPDESGLAAEVRVLWKLQEAYPEAAAVRRVEPGADTCIGVGEAIISYRRFAPEELVKIVGSGAVLPAGITRFRVHERVLGVRFPLEKMKGEDKRERNAELREFVGKFWEEGRIRYYGEPVVLFE